MVVARMRSCYEEQCRVNEGFDIEDHRDQGRTIRGEELAIFVCKLEMFFIEALSPRLIFVRLASAHSSITVLYKCQDWPYRNHVIMTTTTPTVENQNVHTYSDGVTVVITNNTGSPDNGERVFYSDATRSNILSKFSGYEIDKYVIATDRDETTEAQTKEGLMNVLRSQDQRGALALTNDGTLILVFKVASAVRVHLMRSASHGFECEFSVDFANQYNGSTFADLFEASVETSSWCHMFRQGTRASAMDSPADPSSRTFLYLGAEHCSLPSGQTMSSEPRGPLKLSATLLTIDEAVIVLRDPHLGLVSYRHPGGEAQLMSEKYLLRVATMTGVTMDCLISGTAITAENSSTDHFSPRPSVFTSHGGSSSGYHHKLANSRFPRTLDLFALYILCGIFTTRRLATVSGFTTWLDAGGRILAAPKRSFYNFCRAAGVNPRSQLPFPATPNSMRLAVRRIIVNATLPSKVLEVEAQFNNFETILYVKVPNFIQRVLRGSSSLQSVFESAFGTTIGGLVGEECRTDSLKSVRSALLLADHYKVMSVSRFALRHLQSEENNPTTMRETALIAILSEYSHSSRRRRAVADRVAGTIRIIISNRGEEGGSSATRIEDDDN